MIFVGALLHLAVVLLPFVLVGGSLRDPAVLAFIAGVSAFYFGDAVTMRWSHDPSPSALDARAYRWASATGALLLLVFWMCLLEFARVQRAGTWLQVIGAVLVVAGVALRGSAVRRLRRHFRTEIESVDGELVRSGVYRYVRHPSETGLLAVALGATILLRSVSGAALWCVMLVPLTLARLSLEERALHDRFGEAYRRYAEDVGTLLPRRRARTSC